MKTVFVTVGTTSFDELIENITSLDAVEVSDQPNGDVARPGRLFMDIRTSTHPRA